MSVNEAVRIEPAAPPVTKAAKKPKRKPNQTLTQQIQELEAKLEKIAGNEQQARNTLANFQKARDEAEATTASAVISLMADDTEANQITAQEARINLKVITQQFEQAKTDLQYIPDVTRRLKTQIKTLKEDKRLKETALIKTKGPDLNKLKEAAIKATAKYGAAVMLNGTRDKHGSDARNLFSHLGQDESLQTTMLLEFEALEQKMGFEKV